MAKGLRRGLGLAALVALAGCSFHTEVPAQADVRCTGAPGEAPCPEGMTCRPAIGRCVALADLARTPVGVTDVALAPAVGNLATPFALSFQVTAPLAGLPRAYANAFQLGSQGGQVTTYPFTCAACAAGAPCSCELHLDPSAPPPEGPLRVQVEVVDAFGNAPPPVSAGSVLLDLTPPELVGSPSLELHPAPGVATPVSAVGAGASARLCFVVSEPLAGPPQVWAADATHQAQDAGELPLSVVSGFPRGLLYCFDLSAPDAGTAPDGPRAVWADLQDLAGNAARRSLLELGSGAGLELKLQPDPLPGLEPDGGLRYHRAPWGELPDVGVPRFSLASTAPAIAGEGWLFVYEDAAGEREVARAPVPAGPLATLELPGPDRPELYVSFVDRAGNPSPGGPARVRGVDWVATLGNKLPGDLASNPHLCLGRPVAEPTLVQADDVTAEQGASSGPVGGAGAQVLGGASWRQRQSGTPDYTGYSHATYESALGRLFRIEYVVGQVTYEFDGDWHARSLGTAAPSQRYDEALGYDALRGRVVLFGGAQSVGAPPRCDTWEWDGQSWRQTFACDALADGGPSTAAPPPRARGTLAYDPERHWLVLLGGQGASGDLLGDAWAWDGQAWTELAGDGGAGWGLPPRAGAAGAFLPGKPGRLVVVGGEGAAQVQGNETWVGAWADGGYVWTHPSGGTTCGPDEPPCTPQQLAVDPDGRGLALAAQRNSGGRGSSGPIELWLWSGAPGASWALQGSVPNSLGLDSFVAAPPLGTSSAPYVLYGDLDDPTYEYGTWRCGLAGGDSCQLVHHDAFVPPIREGAVLAFDPTGRALLVGGSDARGVTLGDAWSWDGQDWIPAGNSPGSARSVAGLVYDPGQAAFWLYGGLDNNLNDLFDVWTGTPDAWTYRGQALPGANEGNYPTLSVVPGVGVVASDSSYPTVAMSLADDGGLAPVVVAGPAPGPNSTYSSQLGVVSTGIFDGGALMVLDVDAGLWRARGTAAPPPGVSFGPLAALPGRPGVLVTNNGSSPGDLEQWDGTRLSVLSAADPEGDGSPFSVDSLAVDPVRSTLLTFGGYDAQYDQVNTTWELRLTSERPAEVCRFRLGAARLPAGAVVERVGVRAQGLWAQGGGAVAPAASDVVLQLWRAGAWAEVARCPAGDGGCTPASPGRLDVELTNPAPGLFDDLGELGVQLTPGDPNGPGQAAVGAGVVQAEVSYELP